MIKGNLPWLGWACTKGENISAIFSLQLQVPLSLGSVIPRRDTESHKVHRTV